MSEPSEPPEVPPPPPPLRKPSLDYLAMNGPELGEGMEKAAADYPDLVRERYAQLSNSRNWELSLKEVCVLRDDALDRSEFMTNSPFGCWECREDAAGLYDFCQSEYLFRTGQI